MLCAKFGANTEIAWKKFEKGDILQNCGKKTVGGNGCDKGHDVFECVTKYMRVTSQNTLSWIIVLPSGRN